MPRFPAAVGPVAGTPSEGPPFLQVFYVHGFASSPRSAKAAFFDARCRERGIPVRAPDFNEPSFETLTISRMLDRLDAEVGSSGARRVGLVGSSLGGLVAWLAAGRWARGARPWVVEWLLLLAPAFDFGLNRARDLGEDALRAWRETGWRQFDHYGFGERRRVHYRLYEDALVHHPDAVTLTTPALVFQGRRDAVVDPEAVRRFAQGRANMQVRLLDDDHQLVASLPTIWMAADRFIPGRAR